MSQIIASLPPINTNRIMVRARVHFMPGLVNFRDYFARRLLLKHPCIHYTSAAHNGGINEYSKSGDSSSVGIRICVNGTSDLFQISGYDV